MCFERCIQGHTEFFTMPLGLRGSESSRNAVASGSNEVNKREPVLGTNGDRWMRWGEGGI